MKDGGYEASGATNRFINLSLKYEKKKCDGHEWLWWSKYNDRFRLRKNCCYKFNSHRLGIIIYLEQVLTKE